MKVLVIGKGGREHALVWKLAQSPRVDKIYAAPGSPGIEALAECVDIRVDTPASDQDGLQAEIARLGDFAVAQGIDLTVVGPEDALSGGIVDHFEQRGLMIFGPTQSAARIESSKVFAKDLMQRIGVPTAAHASFSTSREALDYIKEQGVPIAIKASGLAAGKGVVIAHTMDEAHAAVCSMLDEGLFGQSSAEIVVEEFMQGEEASLFTLTDGQSFATLVTAQDHKPIFAGDKGPNTGGMGAYAPAPVMTPERVQQAEEQIIQPVLDEMRRLGCPFRGVLYCGLMLTDQGPKVVEFNCRFGDPETQVVLPLLQTDLVDLIEAVCQERLDQIEVVNSDQAAVCVVLASGGYPGAYENGKTITGLDQLAERQDLVAFHAGTALTEGNLQTAGGRVLGITGLAGDISEAVAKTYAGVDMVSFEGIYCRRDIAHRALARL
ncbi:MAG: phosphoribosylamine--glycine ligase [Candidatus Latescibacteria bacterium]|nr:phosphoribosylamine--glycine ligase [Candidatus Latescibacterota bacterium]